MQAVWLHILALAHCIQCTKLSQPLCFCSAVPSLWNVLPSSFSNPTHPIPNFSPFFQSPSDHSHRVKLSDPKPGQDTCLQVHTVPQTSSEQLPKLSFLSHKEQFNFCLCHWTVASRRKTPSGWCSAATPTVSCNKYLLNKCERPGTSSLSSWLSWT